MPVATPTPTPTRRPFPYPTPTGYTPTLTPTPTPTSTITGATPTITPTPTRSDRPFPYPTPTGYTPTPTITPTPTSTGATPTTTPTPTSTRRPFPYPTPTGYTPTLAPTPTPTSTATPTPTSTATPTPTPTPTPTSTATPTPTSTATPTPTPSYVSVTLTYDPDGTDQACASGVTSTYYTNLGVGNLNNNILYVDSSLTTPAPNGYYLVDTLPCADAYNNYTYVIGSGGGLVTGVIYYNPCFNGGSRYLHYDSGSTINICSTPFVSLTSDNINIDYPEIGDTYYILDPCNPVPDGYYSPCDCNYYPYDYFIVSGGSGQVSYVKYNTYKVGDILSGGTIVYLDANTCNNGIIADLSGNYSGTWGNTGTTLGTVSSIYSGGQNTNLIYSYYSGDTNNIATICKNLSISGYTDWVIPTSGDMFQILINNENLSLGLELTQWWTSNENLLNPNNSSNYTQTNAPYSTYNGNKTETRRILPIRYF